MSRAALGIIAFVLFVIATVVAWVDKTMSVTHLLAIGFAGLAVLSLAVGFYGYWSSRP